MSMDNNQDNLEAAMDKVAETLEPTIAKNIGSEPGDPASKQVLIRSTVADHSMWKEAADVKGVSLSEFIRDCLNSEASKILYCQHPSEHRLSYPWAEFCTLCNERLRDGYLPKPPRRRI